MKSAKTFFLASVLFGAALAAGCGKVQQLENGVNGNQPANGVSLPAQSGPNVLQMTVTGSLCASGSYINKPCVQITICEPAPNANVCQTVNDILVDTGSFGLRVFSQAIPQLTLPTVTLGNSNTLAECAQFGDGSSDWGPVSTANVQLGGESAVTVPIQVINPAFPGESINCPGSDASPAVAGFNGILGVGLFQQDCGSDCAPTNKGTNADNGIYFSCTAAGCTGSEAALADQVQNPVPFLSTDNNGVILELPSVSLGGAGWADGYLMLGIDTQTNNTGTNLFINPQYVATKFAADPTMGEFTTQFNGKSYSSFVDSGSNGIFFTDTSLPGCGSSASGWFCQGSATLLSATTVAAGGGNNSPVQFYIGDALSLMASGNGAFQEVGGSSSTGFDWGLPFYLGRNVYVGILGKSSKTFGSGPYWAY